MLPIGLALLFGAAVAAPLAWFDNPLVIAAASIALAVPAWFVLKKRDTRSPAPAACDGC